MPRNSRFAVMHTLGGVGEVGAARRRIPSLDDNVLQSLAANEAVAYLPDSLLAFICGCCRTNEPRMDANGHE